MDSSSSKVEAMKPVILKAGVPLALSLAGFLLARITTRKPIIPTVQDKRFLKDDQENAEEILGLRRRIEDMGIKELQLEKRFVYYQGLKDQEVVLMELHSKMMLEMNRVEHLEREVLLVEAENQRFHTVAGEYSKLLRLDEFLRSENEKLRRRAKKVLRRSKEHSQILRKQCLQIQCKDREIARNKNELEENGDEIKEMKLIIEQLQGEKSAASKEKGEKVNIEEYNRVKSELEQLQKHEALQVGELIYLRWSNACLKQKMGSQEHAIRNGCGEIEEIGSDNELNQRAAEQGDSYFGSTTRDHARSRDGWKVVRKLSRVARMRREKETSVLEAILFLMEWEMHMHMQENHVLEANCTIVFHKDV